MKLMQQQCYINISDIGCKHISFSLSKNSTLRVCEEPNFFALIFICFYGNIFADGDCMNITSKFIFDDKIADVLAYASCKYYNHKAYFTRIVIFAFMVAALLIYGLVSIIAGDANGIIFFAAALLYGAAACVIEFRLTPQKMKKSFENLLGASLTVAFYDDYYYCRIETPFEITETSLRYENVKSVIETRELLLFESGRRQVVAVPKASLSPESLNRLMLFINSRLFAVKKTDLKK